MEEQTDILTKLIDRENEPGGRRYHLKPLSHQMRSYLHNIFSAFPQEFIDIFQVALRRGMVLTFFQEISESFLKAKGCTPKQIEIFNIVSKCLLTFYMGGIAAAFTGTAAQILLGYFSKSLGNVLGTTLSVGLGVLQDFSLTGAAKTVTAMVGSAVGSGLARFGLWAGEKIISLNATPPSLRARY